MTTVYTVLPLDGFGELEFEDREERKAFRDSFEFDGKKFARRWKPPQLYNRHPKKKKPDIWWFPGELDVFVFEPHARKALASVLKRAGEILPLPYEDRELSVLNVTKIVDCLNVKKSVFPPEAPDLIDEYAFHAKRLTEPLFKLPQSPTSYLLTAEGITDPEDEFKVQVEKHGLKGIGFRKLWSDE